MLNLEPYCYLNTPMVIKKFLLITAALLVCVDSANTYSILSSFTDGPQGELRDKILQTLLLKYMLM